MENFLFAGVGHELEAEQLVVLVQEHAAGDDDPVRVGRREGRLGRDRSWLDRPGRKSPRGGRDRGRPQGGVRDGLDIEDQIAGTVSHGRNPRPGV